MNIFPRNEVDELTDNKTEVIYQITDWFIPESDKNKSDFENDDNYTIYIYGTNSDAITICTKVINFQPFFYVKPPNSWNSLDLKKFNSKLKELSGIFFSFKIKFLNSSILQKICIKLFIAHVSPKFCNPCILI